ncbi:MAG: hypothetical protein MRQ09_03440 [Candidatus Midichloria sp.]|nr:hypothetical protein [Candidatus Midichloria sp.]
MLQLGAISGDSKIFKRLLDYCSKDLLNDKNTLTNLNVIDFAYMSQGKEVLAHLPQSHELSLKQPPLEASLICLSLSSFVMAATALTTVTTIIMKLIMKHLQKI